MTRDDIEEQIEYWTDKQDEVGKALELTEVLDSTDRPLNSYFGDAYEGCQKAYDYIDEKITQLNKDLEEASNEEEESED